MSNSTLKQPTLKSSLFDWLNYLGSLHVSAIDMGLSRVLPVAERLGVTQPNATVFTVAGTNGKGSTTSSIAKLCETAGYKTALYQSPHVIAFNERVKINDAPVADDTLINAFLAVDNARIALNQSLSFFEATTLAAMLIYKEAACDVWVLEIGLGGRLDVVNIIDPDVAVITNISIDHTDWLGDDKDGIGYEKAGILRKHIPCVLASSDMPASVWQKAKQLNCQIYAHTQDYDFCHLPQTKQCQTKQCQSQQTQSKRWQYSAPAITLDLPLPSLAIENVSAAITAVLASNLRIGANHMVQAMPHIALMGRFYQQQWQLNKQDAARNVILDAAHNPHGVQFLLKRLLPLVQDDHHIHIVFSMLADKDMNSVVSMLQKALSHLATLHWHVAPLQVKRAASAVQLADLFDEDNRQNNNLSAKPVTMHNSIATACHAAYQACQPQDTILVCGSFHTIADALIWAKSHD